MLVFMPRLTNVSGVYSVRLVRLFRRLSVRMYVPGLT